MIAFGSCQSGVEAANSNSSSSGSGSSDPRVELSLDSTTVTVNDSMSGISTPVTCTVTLSNILAGDYEYYLYWLDDGDREVLKEDLIAFSAGVNTITIDRLRFSYYAYYGDSITIPVRFELKELDINGGHNGRVIATSSPVNLTINQ